MFEQEIAMEKRESSVVPLLLIVALIISIVGVAAYYVIQSGKVLATEDATKLIVASLKAQGPVTMSFRSGMVAGSVGDRPHDPNYRLLEKAGFVKIGKDQGRFTPITLTPEGKVFLKRIEGVTESKTASENSTTYVVPLADRKVVGTPKIKMLGVGRASVEYAWAWDPNKMGDLFDAAGPQVKSFNTWDRGTLIDKYGAKFYHGDATKVVINCNRNDNGVWQISNEF